MNNSDLDSRVIFMSRVAALEIWGKVQVALVGGLARASMILSLLHHGIVLIEARISVLDNKGVLQLNGGRGQKTFTGLVLFGGFLVLLSLESLGG